MEDKELEPIEEPELDLDTIITHYMEQGLFKLSPEELVDDLQEWCATQRQQAAESVCVAICKKHGWVHTPAVHAEHMKLANLTSQPKGDPLPCAKCTMTEHMHPTPYCKKFIDQPHPKEEE